jgi:hypothetical protein
VTRESGVGLRSWIKRLERDAREEMIVIPQKDGTVKKFPKAEGIEALLNLFDRLGAGEDAPPEHPMLEAVRNSSDPEWTTTIFAMAEEDWTDPVEDLSE